MALTFDNDQSLISGILTADPASSYLTIAGTQGLILPSGSIAQRPGSPINGTMRGNTDLGVTEQYVNGAWQPVFSSGGRGSNTFFDDFLIDAGATDFSYGWTKFLSGTGASAAQDFSQMSSTNNTEGVIALNSGTTTTGVSSVYLSQNCFVLGYGLLFGEWRIVIPTLATVAQNFTVRVGFKDDATSVGNNGVFFFHSSTTSLGGTCHNGGASTNSVTTTITAGTWYKLGILINAAASSASFYVNDVLLDTLTTNIPVNPIGVNMMIQKSAGTTARVLNIDYAQLLYVPTTTR